MVLNKEKLILYLLHTFSVMKSSYRCMSWNSNSGKWASNTCIRVGITPVRTTPKAALRTSTAARIWQKNITSDMVWNVSYRESEVKVVLLIMKEETFQNFKPQHSYSFSPWPKMKSRTVMLTKIHEKPRNWTRLYTNKNPVFRLTNPET